MVALFAVCIVLLLLSAQRPNSERTSFHPAAAQMWSTASNAAVDAVSAASGIAADAVGTASDVATGAIGAATDAAQAAVNVASSAFTAGSTGLSAGSFSEEAIRSAISGFAAHEERRMHGSEGETTRSRARETWQSTGTIQSDLQWCQEASRIHAVKPGSSWGTLSDELKLYWTSKKCDEQLRTESPSTGLALRIAKTAAVAADSSEKRRKCNKDHSVALSPNDVLCRVPSGEVAFVALANAAYGELAINWALLLLPVLERVGHGDRAVLAALDSQVRDLER